MAKADGLSPRYRCNDSDLLPCYIFISYEEAIKTLLEYLQNVQKTT